MKYIDRINEFWKSHEEHSFSTTEIALYFHLLKICNSCQWKNPFKRRNDKIQAELSISYNTLKNARNRLSQVNILSFKSQNGSGNVQYTLSNFNEVPNEVPSEVTDEVANEVDADINKEKNKSKNILSIKGETKMISDSLFKMLNTLLIDQHYIEMMCMNKSVKSSEDMKDYLKKFFVDLESRGEKYKEESDAKHHFSNWLTSQLEKQKGGKNGKDRITDKASQTGQMCGLKDE